MNAASCGTRAVTTETALVAEVMAALDEGRPVREDLGGGGRLHIDRALPFLCVHVAGDHDALAAREVTAANASYLMTPDGETAARIVLALEPYLADRFGAFLLLDIGELTRDRLLSEDAPSLPPFEIILSASPQPAAQRALAAFARAAGSVDMKYRSPRIEKHPLAEESHATLATRLPGIPSVTVRFAPIYRVPGSAEIYPDLRERVVANLLDAGLQAVARFAASSTDLSLSTHRALGRKAFVDAVRRADRRIDAVAASFDFLLAVTPINAAEAFESFEAQGGKAPPRFLYRPLSVEIDARKKELFSINFDHFEDPVLFNLYREKQQELDLQLSLLAARETPRFIELGRALYGPVEPSLQGAAVDILARTQADATGPEPDEPAEAVGYAGIARAARKMIAGYKDAYPDFDASVELRDDLPAGLMVSGKRLLISRSTRIARKRVGPLLSHEIGVHLLTYVNGTAQGLRLFRSGLAGYEGIQEGLAVLAEYLTGGLTVQRLRLIAARVVACAAMLEGALFTETFEMLVRAHGFSRPAAFTVCLRLYRGGGLAKDAIYLRGFLEVLRHLRNGGELDPFWMGKISAAHFGVVEELTIRGLLRPPVVKPGFLAHPQADRRLAAARAGLSPVQMIAD